MRIYYRYFISFLILVSFVIGIVMAAFLVFLIPPMKGAFYESSEIMGEAVSEQFINSMHTLADVVTEALVQPLAVEDMEGVHNIVGAAKKDSDIEYIYVYGSDGVILHDETQDLKMRGKKITDLFDIQTVPSTLLLEETERNILIIFDRVSLHDRILGGVCIGVSLNKVNAKREGLVNNFITLHRKSLRTAVALVCYVVFLLILISILLSILFARRLSQPIKAMAGLTKKIGQGEYDIVVPVTKNSEIGHLAESFRNMMKSLKETTVSRDYFQNILNNMNDGVIVTDSNGSIKMMNRTTSLYFGCQEEPLVGRHIRDILGWDEAQYKRHRSALFALAQEAQSDSDAFPANGRGALKGESFESLLVDCYNRKRTVLLSSSAMYRISGVIEGFVYVVHDITEIRKTEEALDMHRTYYQQLFANSPQGIVLIEEDGTIVDVNKGFETLFGYTREQVIGRNKWRILAPHNFYSESVLYNKIITKQKVLEKETYRKCRDGRIIPVSVVGYPVKMKNKTQGFFYIYYDISKQKQFEVQLYNQAFYDTLTALPNRALFMERLDHAIKMLNRKPDYSFAVLLIDLDRFKWVNESLGHSVGDKLLVEISQSIQTCLREGDTLARMGGDEFAVLLEDCSSLQDVTRVVSRIQNCFDAPTQIEENEIYTSASIGIVLEMDSYQTPESILRDADIAMYKAKEDGEGRFRVFTHIMRERAADFLALETELRNAIKNNEFTLHYQPIVSLQSNRLEGFEALIRWEHPINGTVFPNRFIPLAESTGLIVPMGHWYISEACRQLKEWHDKVPEARNIGMSINISPRQFAEKGLVDFIAEALDTHKLEPEALRIEITESTIMREAQTATEMITRLKDLGIKLAIDDFGTGYSSLSYLQIFPIDYLKIDRSFISGEGDENDKAEMVKTIISLARNLGMVVIAEGVEEEKQLKLLRELRCDQAQGFLFSRPLDRHKAFHLISDLECMIKERVS